MQLAEAAQDEAAFSMRVLRHLASRDDGSRAANLAVSLLALHAALALLAAGARGATLDEIADFLGPAGGSAHAALASYVATRALSDGGEGGLAVGFANVVWVDADLKLKASFARVATERRFDSSLTRDEAFFLHDDRGYVRVPFMSSTSSKQHIACGYKVLRLPYTRGGGGAHRLFSMYIYLPDAHDGLPGLLDKLSADPALLESSGTLADEMPVRAFRVPKFAVSCGTNAVETLRGLGLFLPFDRVAADFGDMVEWAPEPLVVSDMYHGSFVEVDEEGIEAAVARGSGCERAEALVDFVADHPFVFLV